MPTIQIRIDDQTKTASAALFEQLGITMSDAINMFLRQVVMRGEIPFTISVPGRQETRKEIIENDALVDALRRYKTVNNKSDFDIIQTEPFIHAVETLVSNKNMRITLQEKAVKVRLNFKGNEYVLDYNLTEPDNVFILARRDRKLLVKDCNLTNIRETLERF